MPDELWLSEVTGSKSKSNVTGEFEATSRRSIDTVEFEAEMNLPLPLNVMIPVPTVVSTPEAGWLSGEVANQRNVVTPPSVDSRAVVRRTVSGIPKLSYTIISQEDPVPVTFVASVVFCDANVSGTVCGEPPVGVSRNAF